MNSGLQPLQTAEVDSALAVGSLLATNPVPMITGDPAAALTKPPAEDAEAFDFRNPILLPAGVMRKLRLHQEKFLDELTIRLATYLRLEISLKLAGIQTISCQKLIRGWSNPTHLTLFKLEPLRGVSVLEIPPRLGLCMVDRLLGGPGRAPEHAVEISEIERALLEQAAQLVLGEWCGRWIKVKELRAVQLGHESNPRFVQIGPPEAIMFVLTIQVRIGECAEKIQLSIPFAPLEPLILQLTKSPETSPESAAPPRTAPAWNPAFSDLCVPVTAKWRVADMPAREVLALKPGDVIRMDHQTTGQIDLCLGETPRFQGRPGTIAGQWAVELTRTLNLQPE